MITEDLKKHIEEVLSAKLGPPHTVLSQRPIGGGCINACFQLKTTQGNYFIKLNNSRAYPGMFEAEAAGLEELRKAKSLRVPKVITVGEALGQSFLLLEFIETGSKSSTYDEVLGRGLAAQHSLSASNCGLDLDNYIGSLPQSNPQTASWPEFYAQQRIQPMAQRAFEKGELDKANIAQIESLCRQLDSIFPMEAPSLLHGDLWSGNVMTDEQGKPVIVDPAVYYGNREMDLAMTHLFGGFGTNFYSAYQEAFPLQPNWEDRLGVCQLYPLLIHLILFGSSYYGDVKAIIRRF